VGDASLDTSPPGLLRLLRDEAGLDLAALKQAAGGESHGTFWATDRSGAVSMLKILPGAGPEAVAQLSALDAVTGRLGDRGYPAPRIEVIGQAPGLVFWTQQRLPGSTLDRRSADADRAAALARLLPEVLRQVEWSLRHYPAAPATRHHLRLARLVLSDIGNDRAIRPKLPICDHRGTSSRVL
jgi:hypothetical protein